MQYLKYIDTSVTTLLSSLVPDVFITRSVLSAVTWLAGSILIWLIPVLFLIFFMRKRTLAHLVSYSCAIGFSSLLTHFVFKNIFMRTRPFIVFNNDAPLCPQDFSFPSGHAAVSFAAATMLASYDNKRGWWYYAFAIFVSYSRIFLSCHFFSDVAAGALLGYGVSRGVLYIQQTLTTRKMRNKKNV